MARRIIPRAILASLICLAAVPSQAITCEECQEMETNRRVFSKEITEKGDELKSAFDKGEYARVKELRARIDELRQKLLEFRKSAHECAEACKPDVVKSEACRRLRLQIQKLESDSSDSEEHLKQVDQLYRDLLECNKELKRLLGETR